jgi:mannitol/fructose-specific phosphotransferase system IIA component
MKEILKRENIILNQPKVDREKAIRRCGQMLLDAGYINEKYIEGMIIRDNDFSTAIGNHIAIPHGAEEYKKDIIRTGMVVLACPDGIDWNGSAVYLVIGIAAKGDEHMEILSNIVDVFETGEDTINMAKNAGIDEIYQLLNRGKAG